MKNFKKIVCILGVVILVGIYILALISAIFNKEGSNGLFMAAIYSTVVIPAFMYAILLLHKVLSKRNNNDDEQ